jgi:hypothetical protein
MVAKLLAGVATILALASPVRADDQDATAVASEWYERMVSGANVKDAPHPALAVMVNAEQHLKACAPFRGTSSTLTTAKQLGQLAACFAASDQRANYRLKAKAKWGVQDTNAVKAEFYKGRSPKDYERFAHQVDATATDATIVFLNLDGNEVATVRVYFAVTPDRAVKAVWLTEQLWEMPE